ncbi:DNA polymerase III subunit gamma/tau [Amorphus orientalis]|uniref:DNA polymerase III subunit gamma/tau n=1 Tax=Amorphus orientalis TaxID=649198 RepID=A0AAE3VNM0_9HYPH|nr:DNA polymerase III subunit gamma/tau [Amorphus orientalis]MDQ0315213.1 DNA polymerase-3 subunit gamma/tau [Amorphus orientalis]
MDDTPPREDPAAPYRVLARKYRPRSFEDLIGQAPMVRTLKNAFETGRIPQAWMLTGVRGVGKTTTARILARALNYETATADRPTIDMPELGEHCAAIMEGRHVDVIEMDAASHTSINDIREITEAARYKPVSARYKVYVIDEVHMLSTAAFNGLLKTLEEPPEHVKFVFATTEIRKVPVTVLSRCQRFDLRRVDAEPLVAHLTSIAKSEGVSVEDEAYRLIARAAEGSVRDALSLMDQAIAHGAGAVSAASVKDMLGLVDRARVVDLFEMVMRGDIAGAIAELDEQYAGGADPATVLSDLAAFVHLVTRFRLVPDVAADATVTEEERTRGAAFAETLSVPVLSRAWQILLKGLPEVQNAAKPLAAAEMVLVRLAHSADLPTPDAVLKALGGGAPAGSAPSQPAADSGGGPPPPQARAAQAGGRPADPVRQEAPAPAPAPRAEAVPAAGPKLESLQDVAALAGEMRAVQLKFAVERQMRPVKFEPGRIEVAMVPNAPTTLAGELGTRLTEWTGRRWIVAVSSDEGGETLHEERARTAEALRADAATDPIVAAVLNRFPGAEIVDVRVTETDEPAVDAPPDDENEE